jgi:hypothetical protein
MGLRATSGLGEKKKKRMSSKITTKKRMSKKKKRMSSKITTKKRMSKKTENVQQRATALL